MLGFGKGMVKGVVGVAVKVGNSRMMGAQSICIKHKRGWEFRRVFVHVRGKKLVQASKSLCVDSTLAKSRFLRRVFNLCGNIRTSHERDT